MGSAVDRLVDRIGAVTNTVASAARWSSVTFAAAAVVLVGVLRLEPGLGFGWSFSGWWVLGLFLFVPAAILFVLARSAASLGGLAAEWPERFSAATDAGVDSVTEVVGAVRTAAAERRGFVSLATGVWGMRKVAAALKDLPGAAAPAVAALSPGYLLVTAAAVVAGVGLVVLAGGLVLLRLIL